MRSVQWKLVVIHIIVVLIVMISSGIFILWQIENNEYGKVKDELRASVKDMMPLISSDNSEQEIILTLRNHLQKNTSFYRDRNMQIFILDKTGKYLADAIQIEQEKERFKTKAIIAAITGEEEFDLVKEVSRDGKMKEILSFAKPIKTGDDVKAIVYIRMVTDDVKEALDENRMIIIFSIIIALVLTSFIGYIFASTVTEPIKTLTSSAKQMARGDLHQRIEVRSNDELGQLTKSFNYMAFELNKTLADITSEKNKLESVFAHMKDGLVAFNATGQIIHANPATYQILEYSYLGDNCYYLFEKLNLDINFHEILNMGADEIKKNELNISGKHINVIFINYLNEKEQPEGVIAMLQDVTEQKRLDEMRKEFVANVSHELRTPLTTVKSYVETILDTDLSERETVTNFLNTINSETDRMTILVQDLLELSKLDNQQIKFKVEKADIVQIVKNTVEQYKIHSKNKKQILQMEEYNKQINLEIDPARIIQVLNNILSNAVKYSGENEKIQVSIKENNDEVSVVVKDTGMGIPEEDLPRLFERFYRVDKARSRAMGGTGLGLSIAKQIMEYHKGDIIINSVYRRGTEVILKFTKNVN
ncbi:MAG TPA: PAS domain-containing sensor histidine kinase [Clostridiales bacterium]|nr:MAG: hypothetical protein A2Y18_00355 [Clostridiales bacterium GWD2_32_19]HCC06961.1 PAS domain-containing sensor histidine kinase [Clostridiales bacterium]